MGGEVRRMKLWGEGEEDEAMGGGVSEEEAMGGEVRRMKLWVEG